MKEANPDCGETLQRECRLNGLPTGPGDDQMIERLVALEEFKIIRLLKAESKAEAKSSSEEMIANE